LTSDGTNTYAWTGRTSGHDHRPRAASFVYDGLGRRMRKTINGTITDMLYDGVTPSKKFPGRSGNPADGPRHR